jgi:nucleoid-associated protein YgaU
MRLMYDSVTAADIPADAAMVAGYVDGAYAWTAADWALHPAAQHVRIAVFADTNDGHVLDVEPGNATPAQAPGWVTMRRHAGVDPTVYCSLALLPVIERAFAQAGVAEPHWWIADWTGSPHIAEGSVATQYASSEQSGGHYDLSQVAAHWPGIDSDTPAPRPLPPRKTNTYTVKPGDTLSSIGAQHDVSWQRVYEWNKATIGPDPDLIKPGQVLVFPGPHTTYTVQPGDTLSAIGSKFGVPWRDIYSTNRATIGADPDLIKPGQVLTIP